MVLTLLSSGMWRRTVQLKFTDVSYRYFAVHIMVEGSAVVHKSPSFEGRWSWICTSEDSVVAIAYNMQLLL